jgi:hypothetical protein
MTKAKEIKSKRIEELHRDGVELWK